MRDLSLDHLGRDVCVCVLVIYSAIAVLLLLLVLCETTKDSPV